MIKSPFLKTAALALCLSMPLSVQAQEEQDIGEIIQNVTTISQQLSSRIESLGQRIGDSANSAEEGTRLLDEMLEAARNVHASLDQESEIWTDLKSLMVTWEGKRDDLYERAKDTPELKPIADSWQERIDKALVLQDQIRTQSTDGLILIEDLEKKREVVLALYDAELGDQVLATMQQISDELTAMNTAVGDIVNQANSVGQRGVAAE